MCSEIHHHPNISLLALALFILQLVKDEKKGCVLSLVSGPSP